MTNWPECVIRAQWIAATLGCIRDGGWHAAGKAGITAAVKCLKNSLAYHQESMTIKSYETGSTSVAFLFQRFNKTSCDVGRMIQLKLFGRTQFLLVLQFSTEPKWNVWSVDMRVHTKYIQLVSGCTKTQHFLFPEETFSVWIKQTQPGKFRPKRAVGAHAAVVTDKLGRQHKGNRGHCDPTFILLGSQWPSFTKCVPLLSNTS